MNRMFRQIGFAATLFLSLTSISNAKMVFGGDVSVDVPATFESSEINRGLQTKTPDDEIFVWFETFTGKEADTVIAEHEKFWKENSVILNDASSANNKVGDINITALDFPKATWKGDPTVVRYLEIGPVSGDKSVMMSIWASPEAAKKYDPEIHKMIDTLKVK